MTFRLSEVDVRLVAELVAPRASCPLQQFVGVRGDDDGSDDVADGARR